MKSVVLTLLTFCLFHQTLVCQDSVIKGDPPTILWRGIKQALSGPDGREYFEQSMKDSKIPALHGTLVSSTTAGHPNTFLVAMADSDFPEVTLHLKEHLEKPLPPGTPIKFEGIGEAFTAEPFMLTFQVDTINRATAKPKSKRE
jgi:hypothetical protein